MIELSPLAIGGIGVVALLALCFAGVRFAFAGRSSARRLVWLIGWDAGIRTAGIAPYTSGANYTLSVLPMFILIGYLAYYAGITQSAFEAARRWFGWLPGGLATGTGVRGRGLLGGLRRQQRRRRGVRQGGDPRDAAGEVRQEAGGGRLRRRRHARFADPAQHPAGGLRHHHRAIDRQAAGRGLRARHRVGVRLCADHHLSLLAQSRARPAHHRLQLAAARRIAARPPRRSSWSS
jgi:hypothetical protein